MIAIVDYQAGNLASVKKAFDHLGYEAAVTADPGVIARASKIVLPGVGNFEATTALAGSLQEAVVQAIDRQVPLLGICLGMQWMFESSQEAPQLRGLGLFAGECEKFPAAVKSPHVGWNQLQVRGNLAVAARPSAGFVRLFHPLLPGAAWLRPRWAGANTADPFPPWWSAGSFLECSFIRRNRGRQDSSFCEIFVNCRKL